MSSLPTELCDLLELDAAVEQPSLLIDDTTLLYFEVAEENLEIVCPITYLPDNPVILKQLLYHNMAGDITLAADDELVLLLAITRLPLKESQLHVRESMQALVTRVHKIPRQDRFNLNFFEYIDQIK